MLRGETAAWRALVLVVLVALEPASAVGTAMRAKQRAAARTRTADAIFDEADAVVDVSPIKSVSASSNKQILAVIDTLKDILTSIQNEEKEETSNFKAFMAWCDKEIKSFSSALDNTKSTAEQGDVSSKEMTATVAHLRKELEDMKSLAEELKDSIDQASAIRDEESDKYSQEMQLNTQSIKQIKEAITIVGKVHNKGGFLQNGVLERLQLNEPGESNYVLGIMKGLLEKLQKTRRELEGEEKKKLGMHTAFMKTKNAQVKSTKSESAEKKVKLTEVRINLVKVEAAVKRALKQMEELKLILDQTKGECESKEKAFKIRSEDRKKEKAALKQAIDFLTKTDGSKAAFLEQEGQQQAPSFLQLGAIPASDRTAAVLAELGSAKPSDFKGAREVVNKLITILGKQQTEEDDKKKYCETEIQRKEDEKVDADDDIKQLKADIESKTGTIATLADEVKDMEAEVVRMRESLDEARDLRKKEHKSFEVSSKDRELAVKVLRQAQRVLDEFYASKDNTAVLVQKAPPKRSAPPKTWSSAKSSRKSIRGNIVTEMLDKVALEIGEEQKKAAEEEGEAQQVFEELQKETREETDKLREEITEKVKTKAKLVVQANAAKETLGQRTEDQKAVAAQLKCLKEECSSLLKNYESRKKARAFETSQLKDVLDILAGSSIAQRTDLLDVSTDMNNREEALLHDMNTPIVKAQTQATDQDS